MNEAGPSLGRNGGPDLEKSPLIAFLGCGNGGRLVSSFDHRRALHSIPQCELSQARQVE